jgi:hypothetical protein
LDLWLALLGASRIVADPGTYSKLREFELGDFEDAGRGDCFVYIVAGQLRTYDQPGAGVGIDTGLKGMEAVPQLPGVFWLKEKVQPGPFVVTFGNEAGGTTSVGTRALPNRATFLTFSENEKQRRKVQQFILPIHRLIEFTSQREQEYLNYHSPLALVRYMSTAQRLFADQVPLQGHSYQNSDQYWYDLLYAKWIDPLMALIACYELIRRGALGANRPWMTEVLQNMRNYFPGIPDTEIIASMLGLPSQRTSDPPLLTDGILARTSEPTYPLPAESLDYASIWTTWKNAVLIKATAAAMV